METRAFSFSEHGSEFPGGALVSEKVAYGTDPVHARYCSLLEAT